MSYPDEWEAEVEAMCADLAASGVEPPRSIQMMNEAAVAFVVAAGLRPGPVVRAILEETR